MIFFKKKYADQIVSLLDQSIKTKKIKNWKKISEFHYTDINYGRHGLAYFDAKVLIDGLRMNLMMDDGIEDMRRCYAEMHGSLLHAMLEHCSAKLFQIEVSGDPAFGDTDFD